MDYDAPSAPVTYYDRSTGLMVFGVLTIGMGLLSFGLAFLILASQAFVAAVHTPGVEPTPIGALIPGMMVYVVVGIGLIWTGIGSCMARRWACALLKIFSWAWLVFGVVCFAAMAVALPLVMHSAAISVQRPGQVSTEGMMDVMVVVMLGFYSIFLVVLPAIWTYFYNSHHVKMTCEVRDPVVRWTDRCPLPVLAVSIWSIASLPLMLAQALSGFAIVPLFGMLIGGFAGGVLFALQGTIWAIAGVLIYLLDVRGLWLLLGTMLLMFVSSVITYSLHDLTDVYQLMHFPASQIEGMQKLGILQNRGLLVGMMAAIFVPFIGYLIYLFRFFKRASY